MPLTIENCTFTFLCPIKWDALHRDPYDANKRHCAQCAKPVYRCATDEELNQHVNAGDCVAIERQQEVVECDPKLPLDNLYVGEIRASYLTSAAPKRDSEV